MESTEKEEMRKKKRREEEKKLVYDVFTTISYPTIRNITRMTPIHFL